jgi:NAD(P)-dependent dehydrogenase (short-subunit alcohol dehydrogenase family)
MNVIAVARDAAALEAVARATPGVVAHAADAADPAVARELLEKHRPALVVLCAGVAPTNKPLHEQTWESFSVNWGVDVRQAFEWARQALLLPMPTGSHMVIVSSGAALRGSPLSGGYAGAKRMQWLVADYASQEAARLKLGLKFHAVLPILNASSELGRGAIAAYAQRAGVSPEEFSKRFGKPLTAAIFGQAVWQLHDQVARHEQLAYQVTGEGLVPVP